MICWHENLVYASFLYFTRGLAGIILGVLEAAFTRVKLSKENFAMVNVSAPTIIQHIGVGMIAYHIIRRVSHNLVAMNPVSILRRIC